MFPRFKKSRCGESHRRWGSRFRRPRQGAAARAGLAVWSFLLLFAGPAAAQPLDADSLLQRIARANREISYEGVYTRTGTHGDRAYRLEMLVRHWAPDRTLIEFRAPDSLRNTLIAFDRGQMRYRGLRRMLRKFRFAAPAPWLRGESFLKEIDLIRKNYRLLAEAAPERLGHPTRKIRIVPRHSGRPSLELWVDARTGFIFKMEKRSPLSPAADVHEYKDIHFGAPDTAAFTQIWAQLDSLHGGNHRGGAHHAQEYGDLAALLADVQQPVLIPAQVPDGFELHRVRRFRHRGHEVLHLLYGDGLTFISLFEMAGRSENYARSHKGSRRRRYSVVRGDRDGIFYNLVSEIPRPELQRMADSLVPIARAGGRGWWPYAGVGLAGALLGAALLGLWQRRRSRE